MIALFKQQPKAFYLIFMLEFWERFGFYTVNSILAYFFVNQLGYSQEVSFYTFGAFSALVYGLVALGGYIGDKILGTKRTILLGLIVLTCGYLALSFADTQTVFYALGIICVGNGLFKANPSSLLAKCYEKDDGRLHGAFTLYYMAINIGSVFAILMGPMVSEKFGWHTAFFFSFVGLSSALANYFIQRRSIAKVSFGPDCYPLPRKKLAFILTGVVVLCFACAYLLQHVVVTEWLLCGVILVVLAAYFHYLKQEHGLRRKKMWVALALMCEAVVFFTLYQQMPTSINFFAIHHVVPSFLGLRLNPQSFQVLNPLWIMILSPILAQVYMYLHKHNKDLSTAYKFALGMTFCGISFIVLFMARFFADSAQMVSSWWLVFSYFFQCVGELLVSALGVAMVAELVPRAISGFIMGMWFLTSAISGFTGAFIGSLTRPPQGVEVGVKTLSIYTHVFLEIGLVTLGLAALMWFIAPKLDSIIKQRTET